MEIEYLDLLGGQVVCLLDFWIERYAAQIQ